MLRTPDLRSERGVALVLAVFAMVVIGALVAGTVLVGRLEFQSSQAALHASHTFLQEALDNFWREQRGEERHPTPRVIIGSHHHQKADSGPHFPTRAIQLPCWTFRNSFAHKVAAFSREDIGLAAIYCDPDRPAPEITWWDWTSRRSTLATI